MRRLSRPTDLRDAALPDPARDEFGAGFALETGGFYIEYRRAYLLCARLDAAGAVAIRNNSYFFGRDRLPHPVMASTQAGSAEEWQSLTAGDFNEGGRFQPLAGQNISGLVGRLQVFDAGLHQWLVTDGLPWLLAFLRAKLALGRGLPFIGFVEAGRPPWRPRDVEPLSERLIEHMAENPASLRRHGWHLALLSGPAGDVPLA
jgi:hypothetical protein